MKNAKHARRGPLKTAYGILNMTARGYGFITPQKGGGDLFVPKKSLNGACHGDKVEFARSRGKVDEAFVIKVKERNPSPVVGTFGYEKRTAAVFPDDRRRPAVYVPAGLTGGADAGQKVVCSVTRYSKNGILFGKIEEILGEEGDLQAEELSVIRSFSLREEFPAEAKTEAREKAADKPVPAGRRDLRDKNIFTIDGPDTRDIDDAVSIEFSGGKYVLGVHIADVSRYVAPGSALDAEAYRRGTSVYFPDRTLPMLPEEISNGICSLNEGEDRYAVSVVMTFGKDGKTENSEIFESIIKSRCKTTYPEIAAIAANDPEACKKHPGIVRDVALMKELCLILERVREDAGSVQLDLPEARICRGKDGGIEIFAAERTVAERIIEQFMIAANETVARFLAERGYPCLYRVHEKPAPGKAEEFAEFLKSLGVNAAFYGEIAPSDFQKILIAAKDAPYAKVVSKVMLKSMQKARYCSENKGHFGLADQCYCHFTSPIRRYPDLFVHRSLKLALRDKKELAAKLYGPLAASAAAELSEKERIADEAERKTDDLYKLAYMSGRIGEEFCGVVSGVTPDSVYCELDNTVEGVIPFEDLPGDGYEFIAERYMLKGKKHKFAIGDKIKVRVTACDLGRMKPLMRICI